MEQDKGPATASHSRASSAKANTNSDDAKYSLRERVARLEDFMEEYLVKGHAASAGPSQSISTAVSVRTSSTGKCVAWRLNGGWRLDNTPQNPYKLNRQRHRRPTISSQTQFLACSIMVLLQRSIVLQTRLCMSYLLVQKPRHFSLLDWNS